MKLSTFLTAVSVLSTNIPITYAQQETPKFSSEVTQLSRVQSEKQAGEIARARLGLVRSPAKEPVVTALMPEKDETPFLNNQIAGQNVWRVTIENVSLELASAPQLSDRFARTLDVIIDPANGRVLKIETRWPASVPEMASPAAADDAADQMRRSGNEVYHAFPDEEPQITFMQALDVIYRASGTNALVAKQVTGQYVLWSKMGALPRKVWAITIRGVLPRKAPPSAPRDATYQYREIVDAITGEWIGGSNIPVPQYKALRGELPAAGRDEK